MLGIKLICVGKMREKHYIEAFAEYAKRLGAYCRFELLEIPEEKLPDAPSAGEVSRALEREAKEILKNIPDGAHVVAMCVEGRCMKSEELAAYMEKTVTTGVSRLVFIVGGSYGLAEEVKQRARLRLSMSPMTFPHHLARVMLAEQIYRSFKIREGSRYHK